MKSRVRPAARALIIDSADRVLLFRGLLPDREPWWFAPGGALDEGETYEDALVREVLEETGLVVDAADVGLPVWTRDHLFTWHGAVERHLERFFVLRIGSQKVDTTRCEPGEAAVIRDFRWWEIDDIRESNERFSPSSMATLLTSLLGGGGAALPIEVGD